MNECCNEVPCAKCIAKGNLEFEHYLMSLIDTQAMWLKPNG